MISTLSSLPEGWKGWIAGIIDGEGCIMFRRPRSENANKSKVANAGDNLWISVTSTDPRMLLTLRGLVGGAIHNRSGTRKRAWVWSLGNKAAHNLLGEIEPYLVAKHDQAAVAREFFENKPLNPRRLGLTPEEDARRESIRKRLKVLKDQDWRIAI